MHVLYGSKTFVLETTEAANLVQLAEFNRKQGRPEDAKRLLKQATKVETEAARSRTPQPVA